MNENRDRPADEAPDPVDDLVAWALDAVDDAEGLAIEARLVASADDAVTAGRLRDAAGAFAAAHAVDVEPPAGLRRRVVAAATAARVGGPTGPAPADEVHRVEVGRLVRLATALHDADWAAPLDPPELADWTAHDVIAHLAGNEAMLAQALGLDPGVPETASDNDERASQVVARHRGRPTTDALRELRRSATLIDDHVRGLDDEALGTTIDWWGTPTPVRAALLIRAFELWTHADDVRRAVGRPISPPPASSLATMSRAAAGWLPHMLRRRGHEPVGDARLVLTGPGGADLVIDLTSGATTVNLGDSAPAASPAVTVTVGVVEFCQAVGNRAPAGGLVVDVAGDAALGAALVDALPALAVR